MAEILVRDLDPEIVAGLKTPGRLHGRSLQKEIKLILEESTPVDIRQAAKLMESWQERLAGTEIADHITWIEDIP